jgi:hypothetical protein
MSFSYPQVGATRWGVAPPAGYRHVRRHAEVGRGEAAFRSAAETQAVERGQDHRGAVVGRMLRRGVLGRHPEPGARPGRLAGLEDWQAKRAVKRQPGTAHQRVRPGYERFKRDFSEASDLTGATSRELP